MLADILYAIVLTFIWLYQKVAYLVLLPIQPYVKSRVLQVCKRIDLLINPKEPRPGDVVVHNEKFYHRLAVEETLGLGEMYMEGWYDCDRLDIAIYKLARAGVWKYDTYWFNKFMNHLQFEVFNNQTAAKSWEVAKKHYDLGNDLFKSFLDPTMNYTCAYWKDAKTLDEAQIHKMDMIARKLKLEPGMRVLDIGCGWGGLCKYLAENYGVSVVGITISEEGAKECKIRCQGLPVEIRVCDYRDMNEKFDRVTAICVLEHVGIHNYRTFFEVVDRCLIDEGIFVFQTIGVDSDCIARTEGYMNKYIFPNAMAAYPKEICASIFGLFCLEDWHTFGTDYDKTCMAWHANFVKNWPTISHLFKDQPMFYRLWSSYLQVSAGFFRSRKLNVWQVVLTKRGLLGGYVSLR